MEQLLALRGEKSFAGWLRGSFLLVRPLTVALALTGGGIPRSACGFTAPPVAPPLPPPSGNVVSVSTVAQLEAAVAALTSDTTVLIQPGVYQLTQPLRVRNGVARVALRGATNDRNAVVLRGSGMTIPGVDFGIKCENATDLLIANLSVGEVFYHPIQLQGELGCDRVRMYNIRAYDGGEQLIKGTVDFAAPDGVDDGILEYSVVEYTTIGPDHGYTNGIDIHTGHNWIIRNNLFRNIRVPLSAPESLGPAVLMWSGSADTVCDGNTFIDCERAIAFGLGPQTGFAHGHERGLICNNFIFRAPGVRGDSAISVWDSPGTKVLHNSVFQSGTYPDAIEWRFPGTVGVEVVNNLTEGSLNARDGAQAVTAGNITGATASLFVDPASGDLHLLPSASIAIDHGVSIADCPNDWDGQTRPIGSARDVGADEYRPISAAPASFYTLAPCRLIDTRRPAGPLGGPALLAAADRAFTLSRLCGIPADARALSVNIAVVGPREPGFFTAYPSGTERPPTFSINFRAGQVRANNAILTLGAAGDVTVYCGLATGAADLVLDVTGYFQ